ncbi:DNA polymerase I [Anaerosalibacter bizertensis]|uniref:DNA polymerase I n=2 Tax=Anaerosalibacter bizertensis TaxID=932217 RepID=A0A9Q4ACH0_9FIRM|nr:DNA polymerase I [Anaerosalibacter bizertensis]MCG4565126.1 DNA polymerase I [Anaerosalibacter bizertensis]MCG4582049.1 DNA polymerase I [Anaerosalibacter bizertensis]
MIIDGSSLLHRGFYALPLLSTKDGIYTNGVYGFLTMFYKITEEYEPDYISVAFDKKAPTFRHLEYDFYKANRQKSPNELSLQFPILKEVLSAMNINQIEIEGYEADDIAGTIAKFGEEKGLEVILVTGDRDYLQLASEKSKVLVTKKGITELEIFDNKIIMDKYGIKPEQFIDLKGLMGDQSDNIPGVPGIGEKTGLKLIKEFGSMENIYENIEKVSGKKRKESLIEYRQQAFMSKKLGEIVTNVPIELDMEKFIVKEPNWEKLKELYEKLEFKSLLDKIPKDKIKDSREEFKSEFVLVNNNKEFNNIINNIKKDKKFGFKIIYSGPNPLKDEIIGICIKPKESSSYYINCENNNILDSFKDSFKEIFESEDIEKIGHNIKEDIIGLFRLDINISDISFDSMIGQYLINPSQTDYSIHELAKEYFDIFIESEEELLGKGKNKKTFKSLELEKRVEYFSKILDLTFMLENQIKGIVKSQGMEKLYYDIELPLIEVLASMEYLGFKIDMDIINELGKEFDDKINNLTIEIYDLAGREFNVNSPKQLGEVLFDDLDLPVIKKTKTGYSTNAEVLDKLKDKHPIIDKILKYRQIVKLKSTYIDGLINLVDDETNRIHSSFNQTVTNTGRISSTEPNLQNIPVKTEEGRKIRKAFVSENENYVLVDGDYSQIELRVLAHISDDPKLKEAFYHNEDIHTKTASEVFEVEKEEVTPLMRSRAKAVNFGIVYGISDYGLSRDLDISRKEAKKYIDNYLKNYEKVKEYMDNIIEVGKRDGYVETILNRRRYLPELKSRNYVVRSFGERVAMNTPIQGSAADIIKIAMVRVYKELKKRNMKSKLILQVHDELIIEAHEDEKEEVENILRQIMESSVELNVPLKVDIKMGESWYETK